MELECDVVFFVIRIYLMNNYNDYISSITFIIDVIYRIFMWKLVYEEALKFLFTLSFNS